MVGNIVSESEWIPESNVLAENICSGTHPLLYDTLIFRAAKEAIEINLSVSGALDSLIEWNTHNSTKVQENNLVKKFLWLLDHLEYVPFDRNIGR